MICALLLSFVPASMPDVVTLTAVLSEDGVPVDRAVAARLSLWDSSAAGTVVWSDDERALLVVAGVLVVDIGAQRPLPPRVFSEQLWLELVIDDQVLAPRVRIGSTPHALEAAHAAQCATLEGLPAEAIDTLAEMAASTRRVLFARPLGCGGGLAVEPLCRTTACGGSFLDCVGRCGMPAPIVCPTPDVGWAFAP